MSSVSFFSQNQSYWQNAATLDTQLAAQQAADAKMFTSSSSSTPASVLSDALSGTTDPFAGIGQANLNYSMNSAVLAAQEGNNRVSQANANINTETTAPGGNLSDQVTFDGSLGVNFGPSGPAIGGAYSFLSGSDLITAFNTALNGKKSEGEAIDTVTMAGNTLTGSTSGPNAHDVFNLTLDQQTGMYTFQLLAPIDQPTTAGSYNPVYLQGLMQATSANGQTQALPSIEMDVYNNYGSVTSQGNWAVLHEGSLTYGASNGLATSTSASTSGSTTSGSTTNSGTITTKSTYTPPINPLTGYAYTANTSAGLGVLNSVNIFS